MQKYNFCIFEKPDLMQFKIKLYSLKEILFF